MAVTERTSKAERLNQFIQLVVRAGCQDELTDEAICTLALDLDADAHFLFKAPYFEVIFSDRSRTIYHQVPATCP